MIEGDRTTRPRPSKIGELIQGTAKLPVPKLVLDWERRAKILEQEVEAQARQIIDLKEELHQQDERIKRLEARIKTMGVLVTS